LITSTRLTQIAKTIERQQRVNGQILSQLRNDYPDLHFTYCMNEDIIDVQPVERRKTFNIYLVDGRAHCLRLTMDKEVATGIVLAEVCAEEEV
jgi:hypothetical protein